MKITISEMSQSKDEVAAEIAKSLGGADLVHALGGESDGSQIHIVNYLPETFWLEHGRDCLQAMWRGALLRAVQAAMRQARLCSGQKHQARADAAVAALRDGVL
jgi:hypothetical protein